jgi:hypothetical protein
VQLTLLGSGTLCAMHQGAARIDSSAHTMHGMQAMSSATTTPAPGTAMSEVSGPASPVDCTGLGEHDGCRLPWAPGQCSTMTACDISATPASIVAFATTRGVALTVSLPALIHSGPTFAPELPPPRV